MITLDNWRERMAEDMRLRDYSKKTQEAYSREARQFLQHVGKEPSELVEDDLRAYFMYLKDERELAPSSRNIAVHGLRFFFQHTLQQEWPVFELVRVKNPQKLPTVLSETETWQVLDAVRQPVRRMALVTIYGLGLRLGEALRLEAEHIDGGRLMVWVRDGKGRKDRTVPLPRPLLRRLREYWKNEREVCRTRSGIRIATKRIGEGPSSAVQLQLPFGSDGCMARVVQPPPTCTRLERVGAPLRPAYVRERHRNSKSRVRDRRVPLRDRGRARTSPRPRRRTLRCSAWSNANHQEPRSN